MIKNFPDGAIIGAMWGFVSTVIAIIIRLGQGAGPTGDIESFSLLGNIILFPFAILMSLPDIGAIILILPTFIGALIGYIIIDYWMD